MDKTREPGTARFGNFINYYSFNPPNKRLDLLPPSFFRTIQATSSPNICILDIGSNAGELTVATYARFTEETPSTPTRTIIDSTPEPPSEAHYLNAIRNRQNCLQRTSNVRMLGVDLDSGLVDRSNAMNPHPDHIAFRTADILNKQHRADIIDKYLRDAECSSFHLAMCFSVTLWVHLNHGDEGLREFLSYISAKCSFLLIEPQPWKCYRTAVRRMKRSKCEPFARFESLAWRETVDEDILRYLVEVCGMEMVERYGQTDWDRSVCLLRNKSTAGAS